MKIEVLTNDGSPIGVTLGTLWGDEHRIGLGGAEYALVTMCEGWQKRGDEVILYNSPWKPNDSPFEQRNVNDFSPSGEHEVVIFFRSPPIRNPIFLGTSGLKVWWSCDQQSVGDYKEFGRHMDRIVCISDFHQQYFMQRYQINNGIVIDLPVRIQDFDNLTCGKVPKRVIFTSVPARGLDNLLRLWGRILERVPDATLVITSDYRLWGVGASNEHFRVKWMRQNNVTYFGALKRSTYLEELAKAELFLYPSNYDELFCIALAEAEVAGAYPITSGTGALPTTNMGTVIPGSGDDPRKDPLFLNHVEEILCSENKTGIKERAIERFNPSRILEDWDKRVFA